MHNSILKYCLLLAGLLIMTCGNPQQSEQTASEEESIGRLNYEMLQNKYDWFDQGYENYSINEEVLNQWNLEGITIRAIIGTWCSDSQDHFPPFVRLMDYLGVDEDIIEVYGVDEDKAEPASLVESLGIVSVPTFIIYRDGIEIGRIVETPVQSLEEDMAGIIAN